MCFLMVPLGCFCLIYPVVARVNNKSITAMLSGRRTNNGGYFTKSGDMS